MERFKNQRAFIDPISIIGVLMLVVTLIVGTAVTTNKNFSLNINEKAGKVQKTGNTAYDKCREESGRERCNERLGINVNWKGEVVNEIDTSNVDKNAPAGQPTCDANGTKYSPNAVVMYGGIDSYATCGSDGKWDVGVGTITQIKPENVPQYAKEKYDDAKVKEEADEAKAALELAKEVVIPEQKPVQEPTVTTTTPTLQVGQPIISPIQQKEQQTTVTTVTTPVSPFAGVTVGVTGKTIPTTPIIIKPKYESKSDCESSTAPNTGAFRACGQYASQEENKEALMKTINPLIKAQESYKQAVNNSYTYAGCQTEGCNITKNLIDNFLIADSYKNYWQEQSAGKDVTLTGAAAAIYKAVTPDVIADKVLKKAGLLDEANNYLDIAFNQRTVLDTADTVFFDKFTPYVSNYQRINKQTIDPNKNDLQNYLSAVGAGALDTETRKATIDLGIVITEELAATYAIPVIATGFSGGLITGGTAAFGQFGAMSTTAQTIKAANECITNGVVDEQCQQDSVRAAVSWLSLGTGQAANTVTKAAGFADEAVFLAKGANTIVSAGNLAVDSGDFVDTCTKFGSNQSSFGCTMSYVALVGDLLGGVADYKSGQLGFSGPKIDVPDIDGTRIANAEELALLAKSNSPNVPRPDIPIVELPAAKPVKPINPLANVDIPKAPDTPSVPKKTFTEIFDEKITNPIRNLLPVSKNDKIAYQNALDKLADTNPTKTDITNALLAEGYNPSKINDEVINNTTNELAKINESSPKNQAVTIAIEKINETKINTSPDINDHELVGYQQGSASRIYQPQKDIRTAIENVPDPLNIIKEMKKANTPEEAYTILIKKLEENGVIVIKNPLDENLDIYIPGKEGFSIPIDTPGRYLGAYYDTTEAIDFSTYTSSSVEFLDEPRKSYIFLHPQFDSLPIGTRIKTLLHETGHYIEQVQLPGVINPNVKTLKFPDGRSAIERPTTEYVSSLYGANGALISAKFGGSQAAIDAGLVAQIELNAKVLGNPDGYLPKADIPKPSVEKTTIPQKFTNWWDETFTKPINNLLPTSKNDEVEVVVSKLNKLMDRVYPESPNLPECRAGLCGWVSDDVEIAFKYNDFKTTQYQVADLNIARGIPSPETNSFKHAITIVEDDKGNKYLIDLTFSQFINKETGIIQHPTTKINTNFTIDNPLAKEIFEKGYIKLDDNTLNEYLNLMTSSDVPQPKVGLDILDQTKTRREVRKSTPDEIEKYYPELVNKKEAPPPPLTGFAKVQEQIKNIFGGKGTNFGDDALLTVGGGTYKSLGGQKLVIDPSRDTSLQQYLITAKDYIVQNRTNDSISRVDLLNEYVHSSLRYADPDIPYSGATQLYDQIYAQGKPAYLGQFVDNNTGVCREFAACMHVALADNGKPSYMTVGDVWSVDGENIFPKIGRHAWVEYIDTKSGQWMVADPTAGFVLPRDEVYKNKYKGAYNVKHEIFVWPEGTPLWQRLTKKITAN